MCGIRYFHSRLVAVLKNSLMMMYISAILIWYFTAAATQTNSWFISSVKLFLLRELYLSEKLLEKKGSKLPPKIGCNSIYHTLIDMRILHFQVFVLT